jgi:multiple sugar transport system ATP-binding protein
MTSKVEIRGLHKRFGPVHVVKGVDLDIQEGEFTVLVGPSGCGKTTLLRSIAGLEEVDEGTIAIGGQVVNDMRPRDRDIAMVFQNYALYPYLTVFDNIAFGLRTRKMPADRIEAAVRAAAAKLEIAPMLQRYPRQLSGGQRQRVAIGRAIVRDARLFLFDEPLSNLDAKLRDEMRAEIKRLHREMSATMIYVTHDQVEAMTLADRIVMLRDGRIEQAGTPLELFERPATRFVAAFLGSPTMNFVKARLIENGGDPLVELYPGIELPVPPARRAALSRLAGPDIVVGIRPEHMANAPRMADRAEVARFKARIDLIQPTGSRTYVNFQLGDTEVVAELGAHDVQEPGQVMDMAVDLARIVFIDPATDRVIY